MEVLKFPAVKVVQNGVDIFMTNLTTHQLLSLSDVDEWDPKKDDNDPKQGYQRQVTPNRLVKLAQYIKSIKRDDLLLPLLPTTILLNSRKKIEFIGNGTAGEITIQKKDLPLLLIDGQHRVKGLEYAINNGNDELQNFQLPVAIMNNVSRDKEIGYFYIINTKHQRVNTGLAERLLHDLNKTDKGFVEGELRKRYWKIRAIDIAKELNDKIKDNPWFSRIRKPNERKTDFNVASEASFTSSLGAVINDTICLKKSDEEITGILVNYWEALRELMPQAFYKPRKYVIQKTTGMFSLHFLLPFLMGEYCKGVYTKQNFKAILARSQFLKDSSWWESGRGEGYASGFIGQKGFKVLFEGVLAESL